MLGSRNETPCRPPTHYSPPKPHTHPYTHTVTAASHKVKSFSRVQKPSQTPQIYMNLQRAANDEGKDDFLQQDAVSMCVHACACVHACVCIAPRTCVDYPASLSPHMPSVTQPPHRNPKLGRLVCTRNLWPLCSHSSTWHPLAAGAEGGPGSATLPRHKVKWRSHSD